MMEIRVWEGDSNRILSLVYDFSLQVRIARSQVKVDVSDGNLALGKRFNRILNLVKVFSLQVRIVRSQ